MEEATTIVIVKKDVLHGLVRVLNSVVDIIHHVDVIQRAKTCSIISIISFVINESILPIVVLPDGL